MIRSHLQPRTGEADRCPDKMWHPLRARLLSTIQQLTCGPLRPEVLLLPLTWTRTQILTLTLTTLTGPLTLPKQVLGTASALEACGLVASIGAACANTEVRRMV